MSDYIVLLENDPTPVYLLEDKTVVYTEGMAGAVSADVARANAQLAEVSHLEAAADALAALAAKNDAQDARTDALAAAAEAEVDAATAGGYLAAIEAITGGSTISGTLTFQATSRTALAAFTGMTAGTQAFLSEDGRIGLFVWDSSNLSAQVTADPYQGLFVPPASAPTGASGAWKRVRSTLDFWASWFGAPSGTSAGDGMIFSSISAKVQAQGGGIVHLGRPTLIGSSAELYIVGANQVHDASTAPGTYRFRPEVQYPLDFLGCNKPSGVNGHGSIIRCKAAAKYGSFNDDGTHMVTSAGYLGLGISTPYYGMIRGENCTGFFSIDDVELDGNLPNIDVGGYWGSGGGWQVAATGYALVNNSGGTRVRAVNAHHHAQDGGNLNGVAANDMAPDERVEITDSQHFCNLRNNFSLTRGKGVRFRRSKFNWSCKLLEGDDTRFVPGYSPPAAGIDLECEGGVVRDVLIEDCDLVGNYGPGLLCVPSNIARVTVRRTRMVGTTGWSCWGEVQQLRFFDCDFIGSIVNFYAHTDPSLAAQCHRCRFRYGTTSSPTGTVYGGDNNLMADLGGLGSVNILWSDSRFDSEGNTIFHLPYTGGGAIFRNTHMKQDGTGDGFPRGNYEGRCTITTNGSVDLFGSLFYGRLAINGTPMEQYVPGDLRSDASVIGKKLVARTTGDGHAADTEDLIEIIVDRATGGNKGIIFKDGDGFTLGRIGVKVTGSGTYLSFSDFLGSSAEVARLGLGVTTGGSNGFNLFGPVNGYFYKDKKLLGDQAPHIANATDLGSVITNFNTLLYYLSAGGGGAHELFAGP